MWLFNVVREIQKSAGHSVEPADIPHNDEEAIMQAIEFAFPCTDPARTWVLKVHRVMKPGLPRSKIITTHRDPRDVLVSFKDFMKTGFDEALNHARDVLLFTGGYHGYDPDYLKLIAYSDIEMRPKQLINELAEFLDIQLQESIADDIAEKFSRNKVRDIIKQSDISLARKIENNMPVDKQEIVYLSNSNYRSFDRNTGFQTGHVSHRQTGDWKKILTAEEQELVNSEFGDWLKKYGYEV